MIHIFVKEYLLTQDPQLKYFNTRVWEATDVKASMQDKQSGVVRTRWVICSKCDSSEYGVRARLVACEVNTYRSNEFYASTPPLESKKILFSEMSTARKTADGRNLEITFVDAKNAYV